MKELRIQVERAVRPLRASEARKDRIREELYAHLCAAYEEELASGADEPAAAAEAGAARRACERLGDPRELCAALQAAVPIVEAALFTRVPILARLEEAARRRFERRRGESVAQWAARVAVFFFLLSGAIVFAFNPLLAALVQSEPDYAKVVACGFVIAALTTMNSFLLFLLSGGIFYKGWGAPPRRAAARAALHGALMAGAVASSGLAFAVALRGQMSFDKFHMHALLGAALLAPFMMAFLSVAIAAERRRYHEWGCLDLGESATGAKT